MVIPPRTIVVMVFNQEKTEKLVNIKINGTVYSPKLAANSIKTLVINLYYGYSRVQKKLSPCLKFGQGDKKTDRRYLIYHYSGSIFC